MKLITVLITIFFIYSSKGYSQITLNQTNAPLESVLQSIEKQTGYVFLYTDKGLTKIKITIHVKNAPIEVTLKECFKNLPYTFKIVENNILLKKEDDIAVLPGTAAVGSAIQLQGTVSDGKGMALSGATIRLEHSSIGTIASSDGTYTIRVPDAEAVLIFSYVGFVTKKVRLNGLARLEVNLTEDAAAFAEIQVVGYGIQKRANVVGAISNINMKELRKAAPSNLSNALGGRVPGIISRMGDGMPGGVQNRFSNGDADDAQIYLRGRATMNNTSA
ncbi:STN domain-containing protein, partial [Pedobacter heparinus]|uniref:STN domain-containing protein n=1 Tax=Pedobacter heparinus TaxID=984 RepID=UPI00292F34AB